MKQILVNITKPGISYNTKNVFVIIKLLLKSKNVIKNVTLRETLLSIKKSYSSEKRKFLNFLKKRSKTSEQLRSEKNGKTVLKQMQAISL